MKEFVQLFEALDKTTKTNDRIDLLVAYLESANDDDKLWAIALLAGKRPKRKVNSTRMKEWAAEAAGIPFWLFEESYQVVGDMAETIALVLPFKDGANNRSLAEWMNEIIAIGEKEENEKKEFLINAWKSQKRNERMLFNNN